MAMDLTDTLLEQVSVVQANRATLNIAGNGSKRFLGNPVAAGEEVVDLHMTDHSGVITYQPTELVLKARSGTPVAELEAILSEQGQMLAFEPPVYAENDTLGGVIACGLSGPRRPYAGSARDFVLGMGIINGKAEHLKFGGEVMKNVAGYDVSRLQVGAMGTLGVILDVAMKVLPAPEKEVTLMFENQSPNDCSRLIEFARKPWPVSASCVEGLRQWIRLSGSAASVDAASSRMGGELIGSEQAPWSTLRSHEHAFFSTSDSDPDTAIWRISIADHASPLPLEGEWLIEWGGAQRWLKTTHTAERIFACCAELGGHATRYYGGDLSQPAFQPLTGVLRQLHANIKDSFDPGRLFNPGRYHPEI